MSGRRGCNRRSVYIFTKRNAVYPMLEAFDAPNPQETCSRRFRSVIPSQALILMNDPLVIEWSRAFASRVLNDSGLSPINRWTGLTGWLFRVRRMPKSVRRCRIFCGVNPRCCGKGWRAAKSLRCRIPCRPGWRRRAPRLSWTFAIRC